MDDFLRKIKSGKVMLILSYAPAGLGHLRVMDALYDGLPKDVRVVILGVHDKRIAVLHRLLSVTAPLRFLMERFQSGFLERLMTRVYRMALRMDTGLIHEQILTLVDQQGEKPEEVLVVCTHFGLAHQLAKVKKELEREREIRVRLVLQVTDDSPQLIWYVEGADLIVVPSYRTKELLESYGKREGLLPCRFEVLPYPINQKMTRKLSEKQMRMRMEQIVNREEVKVSVPISGAAVGFEGLVKLIGEMHSLSNGFRFWVVTKLFAYTSGYIDRLSGLDYVNLVLAKSDKEVVNRYDEIFSEKVMAFEITKPSEQAFKMLVENDRVGGVIMLFVAPVGRQEYDNLAFMRRHGLMPSVGRQKKLYEMVEKGVVLEGKRKDKWLLVAKCWRGVRLPKNEKKAARLIHWCLENGIFLRMMEGKRRLWKRDKHRDELGQDGVEKFWRLVSDDKIEE
jgi:hypothetical protein